MAPTAKKEATKGAAAPKGDKKTYVRKPITPEDKKSYKMAKRRQLAKKMKSPEKISKVVRTKREIGVIKRAGGTIRFGKALRKIRDAKQKHVDHQKKLDIKKLDQSKKIAANLLAKKYNTKRPRSIHGKDYKPSKMRKFYHTQLPMRFLSAKNNFKDMHPQVRRHRAHLRSSLVPGTVVIMVSGRHQCRKGIFLKQLRKSGLCLISGPWSLNRVPLRRVDQRYLIATSTRVELPKNFKVPSHVDDSYFKKPRVVKKKVTKGDEEIFKVRKVTLKKRPMPERKLVQTYIDKNLMTAIATHEESASLKKYIKRDFGLQGRRYAHTLKF